MSDLVKKYDWNWDNNCFRSHYDNMLSLLETEIEKTQISVTYPWSIFQFL